MKIKLIKIIPQFEINSYSEYLVKEENIVETIDGVLNRLNWKKGDFLVHYAGANYARGFNDKAFNDKMNQMIGFYQNQIIVKKKGMIREELNIIKIPRNLIHSFHCTVKSKMVLSIEKLLKHIIFAFKSFSLELKAFLIA